MKELEEFDHITIAQADVLCADQRQTNQRKDLPMIRKTEKLVITFFTTTDAMAMERICREEQADGRMIPVPGSISADCGLAWCASLNSEEALRALMERSGLRYQGIYRCLV